MLRLGRWSKSITGRPTSAYDGVISWRVRPGYELVAVDVGHQQDFERRCGDGGVDRRQ